MATSASDAPGLRLVYDDWLAGGVTGLIFFGLISTVVTLWYLWREDTTYHQKKLLLVAWGVIPPTWFLVEYFFLFLPFGVKDSFGFFQYGQNVASKLWAAVFALISIALYTDKGKSEAKSGGKAPEADNGGDASSS
ncbi:MAG: hypothetical protein FIA97_19290 [Methylococcaceae bacterium]|nr:hypothetical protein [Methylococcaceae bacterium]